MKVQSPLFIFFLGSPLILITCFIFLIDLTSAIPVSPASVAASHRQVLSAQTSASNLFLPLPLGHFSETDVRSTIIRNYLHKYSSPLESYSQLIVDISDKYSLDYRLLVAIAQQESNLCKKIPPDSHNCWGFGIYGDKVTRFPSYSHALETVARSLKKNYLDQGLDTPEKIMAKYTPPSLKIGGPWARGVNQFMTDLE